MVASELRPLSLGEVLDVGIKIVVRHWRMLFGIVLVVAVPVQVVIALVDASLTEGYWSGTESDNPTSDELGSFVAGFVVILALTFLVYMVSLGACFRAVAQAYLGEGPSARESLAFAARRLPALIWLTVLTSVLGSLALLALVIPGVWLFVSWTVAVPALLTEDARGFRALRRSFRLVRGFWWRTFAIVALGALIAGFVGGVAGFALGVVTFAADSDLAVYLVSAVGDTLGSMVSTPLSAAFATVLYFDLRVRKEAFDLKLLAERIGQPREASNGG